MPLCPAAPAANPPAFPNDPAQEHERTSFQTSQPWGPLGNLRADVAMVYGIDASLPERVKSWRDRGYRVHLMTGVSWGHYQDYLYGRFDGTNHEDNAQTDRHGKRISHGGDVYYMCPAENFGEFLSQGVQRGLDAGVEAVHLEEPEFWARAGYSEGFKREWASRYHEPWQPPHSSVDAQWRASKLKYFLYRRALQQVFCHVQQYNLRTGRKVRCYVPTHSLINYAHWCIVSPESSLAKLDGCDGYIAQVWTGTARTPNHFRGVRRERTFETAFLEYGAMQNLVRATGRSVWYLNDPVEDNPRHDWTDYRTNWESTLVASLLQPDVWQYEVAPWPERIFGGTYPANAAPADRKGIPPEYATELQVVMQALNDLHQPRVEWDSGTRGFGVLISDSMMFQREQPTPSDPNMAQFYGLALPLLKRGVPVTPVQLENVALPEFLNGEKVLLLSYQGQKPLSADVHPSLASWVRKGGVLVVVDDDSDPYNRVREWWNDEGKNDRIPRSDLFTSLGVTESQFESSPDRWAGVGRGGVIWIRESPVGFALSPKADARLASVMSLAARRAGLQWRETRHLLLRRGPYLVGAGLDESGDGAAKRLAGRFVNLFDPALRVQSSVSLDPGARVFLLDLDAVQSRRPGLLASGCKALPVAGQSHGRLAWTVEGVGGTPGILLISTPRPPKQVRLEDHPVESFTYEAAERLLRVRFPNEARPRLLEVSF
ncbi:MAG TPA: hypothetical protein DCM86_01540 [Verrucomicrobiales bacterium]|nr:hypothetical protein [Verrucomicrobiales bacterium]